MNPIKIILILALVTLTLVAIRPGLTQRMADQETELIRDAIITNSVRSDPRPTCAGAYGDDLKKLATQHGRC